MILIDKLERISNEILEILDEIKAKEQALNKDIKHMDLDAFMEYIGNKPRATQLAKTCGVGHSVFYGILEGDRRTMRPSTLSRIERYLSIRIKQ